MSKRFTIDDLLPRGSSVDTFAIEAGKCGQPRVIRKKAKKTVESFEIYKNETELKKAANDLFEILPRCKLLKTDNMALMVGNGRKVKTRNPGMSDHHLCMVGLFVAIEAKMPGKDLDEDQETYRDEVLAAGGIFICYHSLAELVEEMHRHRLLPKGFKI